LRKLISKLLHSVLSSDRHRRSHYKSRYSSDDRHVYPNSHRGHNQYGHGYYKKKYGSSHSSS